MGTLFLDVTLFGLYYQGLHIYAIYWNSSQRQEFNENNDTQRSHELMIKITRFFISFVFSVTIDIALAIINITFYYGVKSSTASDLFLTIFGDINGLSFLIAVYFTHEFGHIAYIKYCKCCDQIFNPICNKLNQKRTRISEFDSRLLSSSNIEEINDDYQLLNDDL